MACTYQNAHVNTCNRVSEWTSHTSSSCRMTTRSVSELQLSSVLDEWRRLIANNQKADQIEWFMGVTNGQDPWS